MRSALTEDDGVEDVRRGASKSTWEARKRSETRVEEEDRGNWDSRLTFHRNWVGLLSCEHDESIVEPTIKLPSSWDRRVLQIGEEKTS